MDGSQGRIGAAPLEPTAVRRFLADNPDFLREDDGLLQELGLKVDGGNVVEFGPAAIARVHAAHQREALQRQQLEEIARANFSAQAQTHGAVVDLLDARNHADLAHRIDHLAQHRFGLAAAGIALEGERAPAGWRLLVEGQVDMILGDHGLARMGVLPTALGLFDGRQTEVRSMALVRMAMWEPSRQGVLAFGSADPEGFTPDMGPELVAFLARVVERTAERWPLL
ncbi:MAG TPA: DUF484 family protein [Phenylobacterium sp.]|uniref:DUF484 family protein n=1 Tax=Phenylobacterium sp. TaxID=1871053 RepID=UPI002B48EBB6|nr:DUF484 family protein [Phenylobacterium sp.]HKR87624.1 DUF484 family protein [Phenylobacterium sp.]